MSQLENALAVVIGREPTTEEIAKFYKVKEICGFSDHDSVWSMLVAFGHYEILYRDIPNLITEQASKTIADHKLALEATAGAVERAVKANIVESVRETTAKVLKEAEKTGSALAAIQARKGFLFGAIASLVIAFLLLFAAGYIGYAFGAQTSSVAASWAQSSDGSAARRFSQMNQVKAMLDCSAPYQIHKDGAATYCIPFDPQTKKSYGWRIN